MPAHVWKGVGMSASTNPSDHRQDRRHETTDDRAASLSITPPMLDILRVVSAASGSAGTSVSQIVAAVRDRSRSLSGTRVMVSNALRMLAAQHAVELHDRWSTPSSVTAEQRKAEGLPRLRIARVSVTTIGRALVTTIDRAAAAPSSSTGKFTAAVKSPDEPLSSAATAEERS